MKKTNRQLNQEHEKKQLMRVRPKDGPQYDAKPLEEVVNQWIRNSLKAHE